MNRLNMVVIQKLTMHFHRLNTLRNRKEHILYYLPIVVDTFLFLFSLRVPLTFYKFLEEQHYQKFFYNCSRMIAMLTFSFISSQCQGVPRLIHTILCQPAYADLFYSSCQKFIRFLYN